MIVTGINGDHEDRLAKEQALTKLQQFLLHTAGISPKRLYVLACKNSTDQPDGRASTAENVKKTILSLADSIKPVDSFIFYYAGQANIVAGKLRFNLPGKDITHEHLAKWISQVKSSSMLIVLDCPGAALAVKSLASRRRIIICGARSDQPYSTRFSEYFVPALIDPISDEDGDGRISLLEAFTRASKQLDDFFRNQDLLKPETALLEDDGDGIPSQFPWRYKQDKHDGLGASKFFFKNKPFQEATRE